MVFEVQSVTIASGYMGTFVLSFPDYLTPGSSVMYSTGVLGAFSSASSILDVQMAVERLSNVNSVEVSKYKDASSGATVFEITFLSINGIMPLLSTTLPPVDVSIAQLSQGVAEMQVITVASDVVYIREQQQFEVNNNDTFTMSYNGAPAVTVVPPISITNIENAMNSFTTASGKNVYVVVSKGRGSGAGISTYTMTFMSPVGEAYPAVITDTTSNTVVQVVQVTKGVSPSMGTFTIFFEGYYTTDIPYDASASEVKLALETLVSVGTSVQVEQQDTMNGYSWTVQFATIMGDLRYGKY